jgi:VCBS repeat-containing protein
VEGDAVHVECSATKNAVTGTTSFVNAQVALATDADGNPTVFEDVPESPPPNYTRSGVISNVGDVFIVVYNEQIVNSDGSLTVNGAHMYLVGPTAVGDMVKGSVTCGTTPSPLATTDTVAPICGTAIVKTVSPSDPTPREPRQELLGVVDSGRPLVRSVTDGASTNGSTTVTSATAAFAAADVGASISGPGIPASSRIASVTNATTATITQASTATATGVRLEITRQTGGIQTIANVQATNATVAVATFTPGTTASVAATATRTNSALPMSWSFDATDAAGNVTRCRGANNAPVAVDDAYTTAEDTPLTIAAPGVLGNDTDLDGDPRTAGSGSTPANGTVTLNADGSFTYTPAASFNGGDSFTYKANDGTADSNVATVNITVTPVNDAPAAVDDTAITAEDTPVTVPAPGVVGNDSDAEGDALTAGSASTPANGTVTLNGDGSFTYTPAANFSGADSFTYKANDGTADSNVATVTITVSAVNDAPVAADDAYTTAARTPLTVNAPGVLGNDADIDGAVIAGSASDPANGSVTLNLDGSFAYTTDIAGFSGTDSFTYVASDGQGGADTATVSITITPNGTPPSISVSNVIVAEGDAGTTAAAFTVTRSGNATAAATVKYRTSGGTATAGNDYSAVPLTTLSFAGFETSKTVTVDVTGDDLPETDETFNLVLSAPTGATIADSSGAATIVNDDGAAYLSAGNISVTEGNTGTDPATPATFTITRSGNTNGTTTVTYKTSGGTAAPGSDYTAIALTDLAFGPGETAKTVTVNVTGDTVSEANENLNLALSAPVGATLADATATAYITDDDGTNPQAPSTFHAVGSIVVDEGNTGTTAATFTVTRSGNTGGASTVRYKTSGGTATAGTDYTALPQATLGFGAGETTKTVTVNVSGDTAPEANETLNLVLSAPTGGVIADGSGTATLVNDDGASFLSVDSIAVTEGDEGAATATFTITRSGNISAASTVKYKTTDGSAKVANNDYTAIGLTTVSFAAGEATKTVTVNVTGDMALESNETFNLVLSAPTGATIADAAGTATIIDDD